MFATLLQMVADATPYSGQISQARPPDEHTLLEFALIMH